MIQRYDGTITHITAEGFTAVFGAPVGQEDHARRAVLAGLDLCQRLRTPEALRGQPRGVALRLGLASGPMVVGPLVHEPQRPYAAMGDTLSLATWLQQRATPDTLLVSAATYALVQDEVQGEACEPLACEAPSSSVSVYTIRDLKRRRAGVPRRGARCGRRDGAEMDGGRAAGGSSGAQAAGSRGAATAGVSPAGFG